MKKLLNGILASCLVLSSIGYVNAMEQTVAEQQVLSQSTSESDFFFEDGVIKKYLGTGGDVVIPSTIRGEIVRAYYGFEDCTTITSITLPNTLHDIYKFTGCTNLQTVYVPDDMPLKSLSLGLFEGVENVTVYGGTSAVEGYETPAECIARWEGVSLVSTGAVTELPDGFPDFGVEDWYIPMSFQYAPWAEPHVLQARENDLIPSSLGRYFYNDILRFQIAEALVQLVEVTTGNSLATSDVLFSDTSLSSVGQAYDAGIITGMGNGRFGVTETATREQIAVMVVKTLDYLEKTTGKTLISRNNDLSGYSDIEQISDWAKDSVGILINNELMTGVSATEISPYTNTTIEQCFVMMNKVFSLVVEN